MSHFHNNALIGSGAQGTEFKIERSLRFNSADSAYLSRTPSSAGNRNTWTLSWWMKRSKLSNNFQTIFGVCDASATYYTQLRFGNTDKLSYQEKGSANGVVFETEMVFRDTSAWYHCVFVFNNTASSNSEKARLYVNGSEITSFSTDNRSQIGTTPTAWNNNVQHNISHMRPYSGSFDFDGYLADVHFIDGQALAPTDFGKYDDNNVWQPKAYSGSYGTNGFYLKFVDNSSNSALGTDSSGNSNTWTVNNLTVTTPTVTTSSITSATAFNTNYNSYLTSMTLDSDGAAANDRSGTTSDVFDNSVTTGIRGSKNDSGDAEIEFTFPSNLISVTSQVRVRAESRTRGVALIQCTIGGTTTSYTWQNIGSGENRWYNFSGSGALTTVRVYNNNDESGLSGPIGLYQIEVDGNVLLNESGTDLEFTNNTNFSSIVVGAQTTNTGAIVSKNASASPPTIRVSGGTWSTGGTLTQAVIVGDDLKDSPTNSTDSSDDAVGNYATLNPLSGFGTLSNGNLDNTGSATDWRTRPGTFGMSSGKWYFEWTNKGGTTHIIGIGTSQIAGAGYVGDNAYGYSYYSANGQKYNSASGSAYGNTWTTGDIIGVAFDADAGNLYFYKNGTAQNSGTAAFTGLTSGPYFPAIGLNGTSNTGSINFGQAPFTFTPPSGYKALCTQNLTDPTIADGSTAFDVDLWSGNNADPRSRTLSFGPDLVWIKTRNQTNWHHLTDSVRGAPNKLYANSTNAEDTAPIYGQIDSLNSDGFTLGGGTDSSNPLSDSNQTGTTYVAWAWDGGTSTASNTDGSISSNVRANQSAGFSIVTATLPNYYTNYTIGHGLGATPHFIFGKNRAAANQWDVYHQDVGTGKLLRLNQSSAVSNATANQDSYYPTAPTNSVFGFVANNTTMNFVWYVFTEVAGYSAFGSYEGTGSSPGPFVYTGFRPAFLLYKNADAAAGWQIYDSSRDTFNQCDARLQSNSNGSEDTTAAPDILSNGFKLYATHTRSNANNNTYLYAAFAEHPFKTARAR